MTTLAIIGTGGEVRLASKFDDDTLFFEKNVRQAIEFVSGTGDGEIDRAWYDTNRQLTGTETFNLSDGSILDPNGNAQVFAKVRFIIVNNQADTAGLLLGGGTNPLPIFKDPTDQMAIDILSGFTITNRNIGIPVVAASSDTITIEATGGTATYDIAFGGTSS